MKINEITDSEKSFLSLKGIDYNFENRLKFIIDASSVVGNSMNRRSILKNTIENEIKNIDLFLDEGFDRYDPDVINAVSIHSKLTNIYNSL